jgi:hypothetical protein
MADTTTGERERLLLTLSGLSDDEAYNRVVAARTARRFPVVLDLLAAGDVHLTTIRLLAGQLTPQNHLGVLGSARGTRKAEVEEIVARLAPRPDVPASVRRLRTPWVASPPSRIPSCGADPTTATRRVSTRARPRSRTAGGQRRGQVHLPDAAAPASGLRARFRVLPHQPGRLPSLHGPD